MKKPLSPAKSNHALLTRDRSFVREKSSISSERSKSAKSVLSRIKSPPPSCSHGTPPSCSHVTPPGVSKLVTHTTTHLSTHSEQMSTTTTQSRKLTNNGYNRRLTTTLSPGESKMFSQYDQEVIIFKFIYFEFCIFFLKI